MEDKGEGKEREKAEDMLHATWHLGILKCSPQWIVGTIDISHTLNGRVRFAKVSHTQACVKHTLLLRSHT